MSIIYSNVERVRLFFKKLLSKIRCLQWKYYLWNKKGLGRKTTLLKDILMRNVVFHFSLV